ncbi:protein of unknown function (DUF2017) [Lentzea flava]|nr:protein of unknown function (DUF2017) [Lentzea flava]
MICWDRVGDDHFLGLFEEMEIIKLRRYLQGLGRLIEDRCAEHFTVEPAAPFGAGELIAPAENERLRAILFCRTGTMSPQREREVFVRSRDAIEQVLETLPASGGQVRITSIGEAMAWLRALSDLRIAMALPAHASGDMGDRLRYTVHWLNDVEMMLHDVISKSRECVPACLTAGIDEFRQGDYRG